MSIPSEIIALSDRLNQELGQIEQEATEALNLAQTSLERFPDNAILIQMLAFLNTSMIFVDIEIRQIQIILENLSATETNTEEEIQEAGEDFATKLGRVLETQIIISNIKTRLENLQ